jgi:hypothetical protein
MDQPTAVVSIETRRIVNDSIMMTHLLLQFQNINKSANLLETLGAIKKTSKEEYDVRFEASHYCIIHLANLTGFYFRFV